MSPMRKMSLIPHEMAQNMADKMQFEQRYKEDTRPQAYQAMNIDREMQTILSRSDMNEYEKVVAYNQLLRKYLNAIHTEPISSMNNLVNTLIPKKEETIQKKAETHSPEASVTFSEESSIEKPVSPRENPLSNKFLVEDVPHYGKSKARKLIKILDEDPKFHWDGKGEIFIDGKPIKGSNIKDIIHNASSNPRGKDSPVGLDSVLSYLQGSKDISADTIINKNWKKQLNLVQSLPPDTPDTSTPKRPKQKRRTPLKNWSSPIPPHYTPYSHSRHEWESWN